MSSRRSMGRKVKMIHANYTDHYIISIPFEITDELLLYCYEIGNDGNPHTYIGFVLKEPMKKTDIIEGLKKYLKTQCEVQVTPHKNPGTILWYHLG